MAGLQEQVKALRWWGFYAFVFLILLISITSQTSGHLYDKVREEMNTRPPGFIDVEALKGDK